MVDIDAIEIVKVISLIKMRQPQEARFRYLAGGLMSAANRNHAARSTKPPPMIEKICRQTSDGTACMAMP
jgi:hypothetical protein